MNRPIDQMTAQLEQLQHLNPWKFDALGRLLDDVVRGEHANVSAARGVRGRILSRLQQVHECRKPEGDGFEQIELLGKVRQWRCTGCLKIVTLD